MDTGVLSDGRANQAARAAPAGTGRERILHVARAAFVERGYADVSMQEIATAAGLTKAAIYYHFPDKDALFVAVVAAELDRICQGIAAELALGPPFRGQLERVARFALVSTRGDFGRLARDAQLFCSPERQLGIKQQVMAPIHLLREAFVQAQAAGEIKDVDIDVSVALFVTMIGGQIKEGSLGSLIDVSADTLARMVANVMLDGIGATRPPADSAPTGQPAQRIAPA